MDFLTNADDLPVDPIKTKSHDELGREIPGEIDFWPTIAKPLPIVRCVGRVRNGPRIGERCLRKAIAGGNVCTTHGAQLPIVKEKAASRVEAARMMLLDASEDAADQLLELMRNATGEGIRLKAAESVLDRAGIRGGIEIAADVQIGPENPAQTLAERLSKLSAAATAMADRASEAIRVQQEASEQLALPVAPLDTPDDNVIEGEVVSDTSPDE